MVYSIIGGTGTLGQELLKQLSFRYPSSIINVFSRCELKQAKIKDKYISPNIRFILGDITRPESLERLKDSRIVFHVAALKRVDTLEENPEEAIAVNVQGTTNVANFCIKNNVDRMIFFTTDKAVDPVNAYGFTKAIAEKVLQAKNKSQKTTSFVLYRWGNIIGSRGSLLESIDQLVKQNRSIKLTDFAMTRFWILIEEAVQFVVDTHLIADKNSIYIPPLKASRVIDLIDAYLKVKNKINHPIKKIAIRPGEKIHENMYSFHNNNPHEWNTSKNAPQYSSEELVKIIEAWLCKKS
jgi:UDP-N-acetylglucosamine 4,6-dehydratase